MTLVDSWSVIYGALTLVFALLFDKYKCKQAILIAKSHYGLVEVNRKDVKGTLKKTVYADRVMKQKHGNLYMHHKGSTIGNIYNPMDVIEVTGTTIEGYKKAVIIDKDNLKIIGVVDVGTGEINLAP